MLEWDFWDFLIDNSLAFPFLLSCSYSLTLYLFNVWQINTMGLQEHIPVQYPEVVLSVEIYHNFRKRLKVFIAMLV
jgi:hypothetical protein